MRFSLLQFLSVLCFFSLCSSAAPRSPRNLQPLLQRKRRNNSNSSSILGVRATDRQGVVVSVDNMLVNKEHKFLFCPIQKAGSSLWSQLFLRMQGDPHWFEPPWHKKLPTMKNLKLSNEELTNIMNDPSWTKAVFFRDPSRRLLSAYKYCISNKHQVNHYRNWMTKLTKSENFSWPAFYESVTSELKHQNLHWRPQVDFCGLHRFYPLYNFIGNLELSWLHGPMLLRKLGIWEKYGAREWSLAKVIKTPASGQNRPGRYNFKKPENYNTTDCMFCENFSPHQSNYGKSLHGTARRALLDEESFLNKPKPPRRRHNRTEHYLTRNCWSIIRHSDFYARDYDIFSKIPPKPFRKEIYFSYPPPPNVAS